MPSGCGAVYGGHVQSRAARCGFSARGTPDAAAQRVRLTEDLCDERSIDDHRRTPRPEVARVKTAPSEKAHAEDLEELVVYRVEVCLRIVPLAPLHLDLSVGLIEERDR